MVIDGEDVAQLSPEALRKKRPTMQMVFQDPQASLNPRMTLARIIGEPLDEHTDWTEAEEARPGLRADGSGRPEPPLRQPLSA